LFSDYLIFIDESGDHGLDSIDRHYPVFVLCGVLIKKDEYVNKLSVQLDNLKMDYRGHNETVLHEREIRKPSGEFSFLQIAEKRATFNERVAALFRGSDFQLISSIIHKLEYAARYLDPINPYDLSMSFVLERAFLELNSRGQGARRTTVIVESRGKVEDAQLKAAFERIVTGNNACGRALPFSLRMVPKSANSPGLQLADLAARPLGIRSIRPEQPNQAYEVVKTRIRRDANGQARGYGVKLYP